MNRFTVAGRNETRVTYRGMKGLKLRQIQRVQKMKNATNTLSAILVFFMLCGSSISWAQVPGDQFDLRHWKLTLPLDGDRDGRADEIKVAELQQYSHPDFFYLDDAGYLVFSAPNKAVTTPNSTNTRSELRQMFRSFDTSIGTHDPGNNFSLKAHDKSRSFADIGGQLESTLRVLHVSRNAKYPEKHSAFSVVVGQIHAIKDEALLSQGFGYGNEPVKIFYKKWPDHSTGSVFWTYERNLERENPERRDIIYPVWGNTWDNPTDPGESGIALGELFNYNINVFENTVYLNFRTLDPARTVTYQLDLSNNVDAYGNVDEMDNPRGYSQDAMYFKAGVYNQCGTRDDPSFRYPACPGAGNWQEDRANGDYVSVAFKRIQLTRPVDPKRQDQALNSE